MRKRGIVSLVAGGFFFLLVLDLASQEKTLDELLNLGLNDLLNLKVVSALKIPETINRTPATVRVITAEDIRANGYFTLEDALSDLPGIQFRNILGFNSYSFFRGVPSQNNKILVLVDGILVNELNSGGYYGGLHYNLSDVERIEVVYGPASALYGTNAVSGIISIITRDPKTTPGGRASAGLGNFGTRLADARYGYYDEHSDFGFKVAAMVKQSDKADLKGVAGDDNWTEAMENFENDASVEALVRFKNFRAGFLFQDKDAGYATAQLGGVREGLTPVSDHGVNWHVRFLNTWLSYELQMKKSWSLRSTAYYRNATVPDDTIPVIELAVEGSAGRQYRYYRPNDMIGNETQFQWTPGPRWHLSFGFVFERERLAETISITQSEAADIEPAVPPRPNMLTDTLLSGFVQAQVALRPELELFIGARHDESSYYGSVTTPRAGLVFNRGKLTAKLLYGRAFRAPKPWDYTNGLGNPDLEPEKMSSLEAAGAWLFSPYLRFEISAYHNRLSNLLTRINEGDSWWWSNAGSVTTDGVEAGFLYRRGSWNAWAYYTYTASLNADDEQVPEIAPHGATLGLGHAFTPDLRLTLRGQYLGARKNTKIVPATGSDRIGDAFILHAALSLRIAGGFDAQIVVDNLLDAVYFHTSNLPAGRFRQPQRSVRIVAGYSF